MEGIKRALRKLFGGKKDKQEGDRSRSAATPRATLNKSSPQQQQQQQRQAGVTAGSSPSTAKPLPPSHPLATGQQDNAHRAVPRSDGARTANSASNTNGAVGGMEGMNGQQHRDAHNVSPPAPSDSIAPEGEGRSQRVSEVEEVDRDSLPPPPPPKSDVGERHLVNDMPEENAGLATTAGMSDGCDENATVASLTLHKTTPSPQTMP